MIVVVTGGRDYRAFHLLSAELDAINNNDGIQWLIHGSANGADRLAGQWAGLNDVDEIRMPARWVEGRSAGPRRNRRMLKFASEITAPGERLLLLAFPGGPGTASCIREAERIGIEIRRVDR
ncbi:MAG: DUF2493 domain-containing protein [Burkholderiales bacterium]|nr:DUF2493 domain-containing protein [Burkholderiales bacterium]